MAIQRRFSWAGMRGVVTLAAAFVLPADLAECRDPRPRRLCGDGRNPAAAGLSLPWLARRLRIEGPGRQGGRAGGGHRTDVGRRGRSRRTGPHQEPLTTTRSCCGLLRDRGESRLNNVWERLGRTDGDDETPERAVSPAADGHARRPNGKTVLRIRDHGTADSDVLDDVMEALDVEESMIDRRARAQGRIGRREDADHAGEDSRRLCETWMRHRHDRRRRPAGRAAPIACGKAPDGCTCGSA